MQTQLEIYKLHPNTTYRFRVWATNKLGPGDYAEVVATTKALSNMPDNEGQWYKVLANFLIYFFQWH